MVYKIKNACITGTQLKNRNYSEWSRYDEYTDRVIADDEFEAIEKAVKNIIDNCTNMFGYKCEYDGENLDLYKDGSEDVSYRYFNFEAIEDERFVSLEDYASINDINIADVELRVKKMKSADKIPDGWILSQYEPWTDGSEVEAEEKPYNKKIVNTITGDTVAKLLTNRDMSLDEAIEIFGAIIPDSKDEDVDINGELYYYEDLELLDADEEISVEE